MKGRMKRTLARILAVIMVVSMMPMTSFGAASDTDKYRIGDTGYATLNAAIAAVQDGETIIMLQDDSSYSIEINKPDVSFTLDLDGNNLGDSTSWYTLKITAVETLTIVNGTIKGDSADTAIIGIDKGAVILDGVNVFHLDSSENKQNAIENNGGDLTIISGDIESWSGGLLAVATSKDATTRLGTCTKTVPSNWVNSPQFSASVYDPVAKVNGVEYADLERAAAEVPDGGTIVLLKAPDSSKTLTNGTNDYVLDLNNLTIEGGDAGRALSINTEGTVTIQNGILSNTSTNLPTLEITKGTVYLKNVNVRKNATGATMSAIQNGGQLHLISGFYGQAASSGVAAITNVDDATVNLGNCSNASIEDWKSAFSFSVTEVEPTVSVNGVGYADMERALNAVPTGGTIKVHTLKRLAFGAGKNVTIDLNGMDISGSGGYTAEITGSNCTVTITNGTISSNEPDSPVMRVLGSDLTVVFDGVTIEHRDNLSGNPVIENSATVVFKNVKVDAGSNAETALSENGNYEIYGGSTAEPVTWRGAKTFTVTFDPAARIQPSSGSAAPVYYSTLQDAIDAWTSGDTIYLEKDLTENITTPEKEAPSITYRIDLNEHTLTQTQILVLTQATMFLNGTLDVKGTVRADAPGMNVSFQDIHLKTTGNIFEIAAGTVRLLSGDYETTSDTGGMKILDGGSGSFTVVDRFATDADQTTWSTIKSVHVGSDINALAIAEIQPVIATGQAAKCNIRLTDAETQLVENTDYKVSYENNTLPGTAKAIVTGIGKYGGKREVTYTVLPGAVKDISYTRTTDAVILSWAAMDNSTGTATTYKASLYDGNSLVDTQTVSNTTAAFAGLSPNKTYKAVVTAGITMNGTVAYGQESEPFSVTTDKIDLLTGKTITLSQTSYTYDGKAKKPTVTVAGVDASTYTVSYSNNINAGTATVTVKGTGDYKGTLTKTFTIKKGDMTGIKATGKTVTYNGSAHTITVSGVPSGAKVTYKTSSSGTYSTTKPTRTSAGTTTVYYKVTKANYNDVTGSAKIVVNKRSISSASLSYTKTTYSGSAKKPTVTVKNSSGTKLTKDTHYTVSYASGRTKVGRYKVTITGKGNYTGTITKYFTIVPKAPSSASAKLYGYDDVKFSWSKATGASGYAVYYKRSTSSSYTLLTRTTGTSVKKANLVDGVKYYFKVVPYYKSGDTRYVSTSYKTASVYTLKKMGTPTAATSGTKAKISWKKINGATGYHVVQYKKKNGKYVKLAGYYTTGTYKLFTASKGATRYYQIRAYKTVDGKKIFGPWSAKRAYKRK